MGVLGKLKAVFQADQWRDSLSLTGALTDSLPGGLVTFEGGYKAYADIYRSSYALRSVISFRANNTASIPLKVYRHMPDDAREALRDHALTTTIENPNPQDSRHTWLRDLSTDLDIFDVTFWKMRPIAGQLVLTRLFPDAIQLMGNNWQPDVFRERLVDGTHIDHDPHTIMWIHGYGGRRGASPMEALKTVLAEDEAESIGRQGMARNQWRSHGVIERPRESAKWDDVGRGRFLEQMAARYAGGANAGRPLLLEEGMQWKSDSIGLRSSDYVETRKLTLATCCLAYHMSPQTMGIEGAPYGSMTEYNRQLYTNVLGPRLDFLEGMFTKQLVPQVLDQRGVYLEFELEGKLRGSFREQADIATVALGGKAWMTVQEMRGKMNLPELSPAEMEDLNPAPPAPVPGPDDAVDPVDDPKPSDDDGKRMGYKADITANEMLSLRAMFVTGAEDKFRSYYARYFAAAELGTLDRKTWNQDLTGMLHLLYMDVSSYFGKMAAVKIDGEYSVDRTVNYWTKIAKDQAEHVNKALAQGLRDGDPADIAAAVQGEAGKTALSLCVRASSWGVMEAARQNVAG